MCKYCGNLWTGECSETMNTIKIPINIGDYLADSIFIETQIFEMDDGYYPYDREKGASLLLTFTVLNGNAEVVKHKFPINYCPVCGADLSKL